MSQPELVAIVLSVLEESQVDYMVTGSIVSSLQGEPRATHDVDIVVNITPSVIPFLVKAFPSPRYYLSENSIREAISHKSMFNLLDSQTGDKIDFWLLTDDPFDQERFNRKIIETVWGMKMKISAPEDTILMKLRWSKLSGGSSKQQTDALRVFEVQMNQLDLPYIEQWAKRMEVENEWREIKLKSKPL